MGRKKLANSEKRNRIIQTRVNQAEGEIIDAALAASGETEGTWIRETLLREAKRSNRNAEPKAKKPASKKRKS